MDIAHATQMIEDFLLEAGTMALEKQGTVKCFYKEGQQALTETDLAVSKLAQERFVEFLSLPDHVLIDEESIQKTPSDVFSSSTYQWVLDPIDGTAGYALGRKMWGVSLAVLDKGRPVAGGIYMPAVGYFLLADDRATYKIDVATKQRTIVTCGQMVVNSQTFVESFYCEGGGWYNRSNHGIWRHTPESAVQGGVCTLLSQSAGSTIPTVYSIWDAAGILALARHTGLICRSMKGGAEWGILTAQDFKDNWKLSEDWLLCHPENFDYISTALKGEQL